MKISLVKLLQDLNQSFSNAEGRRYIAAKIVKYNDNIISDVDSELDIKKGDVIKIGNSREEIIISDEWIERLEKNRK